jgi:hypothetical protein
MNMCESGGVRGFNHGLLCIVGLVILVFGVSPVETRAAKEPGRDLFELPYVYLLRGDENFAKLSPSYIHTVPSPDSEFTAECNPLSTTPADSAGDTLQYFALTVKRIMSLRLVLADSSGKGLVVHEFARVPSGEYTLGHAEWPSHVQKLIAGRKGINVYLVADKKLQSRFRFDVNDQGRFSRTVRTIFPPPR